MKKMDSHRANVPI